MRLAGKEEGRSSGDQLCAWRACPQVARDLPHHFKKHRIDLSLCGHLLRRHHPTCRDTLSSQTHRNHAPRYTSC